MVTKLPTTRTRIRPMRLTDLKQVTAIDHLSFSMPWPEHAYRFELTGNPASLLWVAEADSPGEEKSVRGMIVVWLILDEAHIATIAVHPDFREKGIGKKLLAVALQESIQRGAREVTLEVRASNKVAQDFYLKFGFKVIGRRPRYYRDNNEDAVLMTVIEIGDSYTL